MKKSLLFLLNLFIFNLLAAQNATVAGRLTDAKSGYALIGASIKTGKTGTTTDADGRFKLSLPEGEHLLEFSYAGFDSKTEKVVLKTGETRTLNLALSEAENILQTATVTAGRFEKPLGEVTVSLEVVKPKLVQSTNTTQVDQVLEKVPGVSMIDGQANIRGGSGYSYGAGSRVLLLIDDLPALQADAGYPNWADVAVENIGQIEVLKGAASALYGSSAMNGIINIRTGFAKNEPETEAAVFYKIYDNPSDERKKWWGKNGAFTRTDKDSFQVVQPFTTGVSFAHRRKMGKLDFVFGSYGLFENSFNRDSYKRYGRFTPNFRYRFSERLTVGLNTNFNFGKSGSFFLWAGDGAGNYQAGLNSQSISSGRFRFTIDPTVTYNDRFGNRHKFLGRYYGIKNNNNRNQSNTSNTTYGEYQFQRNIESVGLVVTAGAVAYVSKIEAALYGNGKYTSKNYAAFLQLDQKVGGRLNLSAGLRAEKFDLSSPEFLNTVILKSNGDTCLIRHDTIKNGRVTESKPVFRLGANYRVGEATYFRASYGQGYRFPTIAEKFITTDFGLAQVLPNAKLTSETGWTAEFGLKQGFKISDWRGFFDATAFISEYTNMMEFTFELLVCDPKYGFGLIPSFSSKNVGNTRIKGLEFVIAGQGKIGNLPTSLLMGYTKIDPKYRNWTLDDTLTSSVNYNVLKYRFKHTFKFDAETEVKKLVIGLSLLYNSNMEAVDRIFELGIPGVGSFRAAHNHGFHVFDARLGYNFTKKYKLSFIAGNVLNNEYSTRPGALEAPRNYALRLDGKF